MLEQLLEVLIREKVDVLLISGDVFDNNTPGSGTLQLYYNFLSRAAKNCRLVVILGGNHDSPAVLEAPRELLHCFNIEVIGSPRSPGESVIALKDQQGKPELLIGAIPYLSDSFLRRSGAGETMYIATEKLLTAWIDYYAKVTRELLHCQQLSGGNVPLVLTGHLFAGGNKIDSENPLSSLPVQLGTLPQLPLEWIDQRIDYFALGHLHRYQVVGAPARHCCYCGSPMPLGFAERDYSHGVVIVDLEGASGVVNQRFVPLHYQTKLRLLKGDGPFLRQKLTEVVAANEPMYLEIQYDSSVPAGELMQELSAMLTGSKAEILIFRNLSLLHPEWNVGEWNPDLELEDLTVYQVFDLLLQGRGIEGDSAVELQTDYAEIARQVLNRPEKAAE